MIEERELKYAFLAGLLEGDGCIQISTRKSLRMKFGIEMWMYIEVSNTKRELLEFLVENFEGRITSYQRKGNASLSYTWRLERAKASALLLHLYSYLIIKKKQTELAIKFQGMVSIRGRGSNIPLTQKEHEERVALVEKMHVLNKRGRVVS